MLTLITTILYAIYINYRAFDRREVLQSNKSKRAQIKRRVERQKAYLNKQKIYRFYIEELKRINTLVPILLNDLINNIVAAVSTTRIKRKELEDSQLALLLDPYY